MGRDSWKVKDQESERQSTNTEESNQSQPEVLPIDIYCLGRSDQHYKSQWNRFAGILTIAQNQDCPDEKADNVLAGYHLIILGMMLLEIEENLSLR